MITGEEFRQHRSGDLAGIDSAKFAGAAAVGITGAGHSLLGADLLVPGLQSVSVEALRKI
jgi:hypothetical protein